MHMSVFSYNKAGDFVYLTGAVSKAFLGTGHAIPHFAH